MSYIRLTIQTAGPAASLAEALVGIGGAASVTEIDFHWDTGLIVQSQRISKVEVILDSLSVVLALEMVEEWVTTNGVNTVLADITPVQPFRLQRDD